MDQEEIDQTVAQYNIDPKTHPIYLQEFEYVIFDKMLTKRFKLFHKHKWVYRLDRPMGDVFVVGNNSVTAMNMNAGRYCSECQRVEFVPPEMCAKHTDERWTQLDMIALGLK
jgi:hypothetical protein